jgi:hypothetical protein
VTNPRRCVFCGARAKLTHEHVFPRWIEQYIPGEGGFTNVRAMVTDREILEQDSWRSSRLDLRVRAVCGSCNNGWMSKLEGAVQSILKPILLGVSPTVSGADRKILARWVVKTGIVMNAWHGDKLDSPDPLAKEAVRAGLRPEHVKAWFGRCIPMPTYLHTDQSRVGMLDHHDGESFVILTSVFSVGPVVFQSMIPVPQQSFNLDVPAQGEIVPLWPYDDRAHLPLRWDDLVALSVNEVLALTPSPSANGASGV